MQPVSRFTKVRLAATIALLCAVFMPLSECTGCTGSSESAPSAGKELAKDAKEAPQTPILRQLISGCSQKGECRVVAEELDFSGEFWVSTLKLLTFSWPLIFMLMTERWRGRRFTWLLHLLELLLCGGTLYMLWGFVFLGELRYGATVVIVATLTYAVTALIAIVQTIRVAIKRRRERKRPPPGG